MAEKEVLPADASRPAMQAGKKVALPANAKRQAMQAGKKTSTSKSGDDLLAKYQTHEKDTGSTEVQVVVLTKKIAELTKHLKDHKHDFDSRVGLLKMVGKRRRLLNYLKKSDDKSYTGMIADLKLRK